MQTATEERQLIKVRATKDGTYNGYYRLGPKEEADGTITEGDIFTVDATLLSIASSYDSGFAGNAPRNKASWRAFFVHIQ